MEDILTRRLSGVIYIYPPRDAILRRYGELGYIIAEHRRARLPSGGSGRRGKINEARGRARRSRVADTPGSSRGNYSGRVLFLVFSLSAGVRMSGFRRDLEDPNGVTGRVFISRGIVKSCSSNSTDFN